MRHTTAVHGQECIVGAHDLADRGKVHLEQSRMNGKSVLRLRVSHVCQLISKPIESLAAPGI